MRTYRGERQVSHSGSNQSINQSINRALQANSLKNDNIPVMAFIFTLNSSYCLAEFHERFQSDAPRTDTAQHHEEYSKPREVLF